MLRGIFALTVALFAFVSSSNAIMTPAFLRKKAQSARIPQAEILEPEKYTVGDSQTQYSESYYTQTLDHFNYGYGTHANLQWRMRYLYSQQYWGGAASLSPIFVYCGNEGDITGFWNNSGYMVDTLAPQFKAYLLFPEHRYFGQSLPFGADSLSKTNLVYLTPDQAMADYAIFLHYYKTEVLQCVDCPVIAFGGSYGGMLAAWMRMKYPNVVDGSWAASAPVLYFDDVTSEEAFFSVASWDFGNVTAVPNCAQMIKEGYNRLDKYINVTDGTQYQQLNQIFNTCTPLTSNQNISALEDWLTNGYTYMAMVDYPYPTSFLTPMPGNPVNFSCQAFIGLDQSADDQTLFTAVYNAVKVFYNYQNLSQCNEIFDQSSGLGTMNDEAWGVLACTEIVIPQGSNGVDDIFPARPWSYQANTQSCQATYGVQSRYDWALNEFGGWDASRDFSSYSNIFFSNGLLDPWHPGGVLSNISDTVVAYVIPESAHHLDLRSPNPADPDSVVLARQIEATYINTWVTQKQERVRSRENFISI